MASNSPQVAAKPFALSEPKIDMIAGTCAGFVSTIVAHPLDTVKVRFQLATSDQSFTIRSCVTDIYRNEGMNGFFKGVLSPITARVPISASLFLALGFAKRKLEHSTMNENLRHFLCGFFAGFMFTNIAFVFELLKVRA